MNVAIRSLPSLHIAAASHAGGVTPGVHDPAAATAFDQVAAWLAARDLFTAETRCFGIFHPAAGEIHPYEAACTIPPHITGGEGAITVRDIPAATYAVVQIRVPNDGPSAMATAISGLNEAMTYLEERWLPESQYRSASLPALEHYLSTPGASTIAIDFHLPVVAK